MILRRLHRGPGRFPFLGVELLMTVGAEGLARDPILDMIVDDGVADQGIGKRAMGGDDCYSSA
jgi:hypothetical protein